ncbi:hypothetical protein IG631_21603 [Alternaria alternata]|nr:hypothetical protein IG631_21603 [Alternaria alternata]
MDEARAHVVRLGEDGRWVGARRQRDAGDAGAERRNAVGTQTAQHFQGRHFQG